MRAVRRPHSTKVDIIPVLVGISYTVTLLPWLHKSDATLEAPRRAIRAAGERTRRNTAVDAGSTRMRTFGSGGGGFQTEPRESTGRLAAFRRKAALNANGILVREDEPNLRARAKPA